MTDREFMLACGIAVEDLPAPTPEPPPQSQPVLKKQAYLPTGCTCFLGHPPCGFCETYDPDATNDDEEEQPL